MLGDQSPCPAQLTAATLTDSTTPVGTPATLALSRAAGACAVYTAAAPLGAPARTTKAVTAQNRAVTSGGGDHMTSSAPSDLAECRPAGANKLYVQRVAVHIDMFQGTGARKAWQRPRKAVF